MGGNRGFLLGDTLVAVFSSTVLLTIATPFARHTGKVLLQTTPNVIKDRIGKSLSEVPSIARAEIFKTQILTGSEFRHRLMRVFLNVTENIFGLSLQVRCLLFPLGVQFLRSDLKFKLHPMREWINSIR